MLEARVQQRFFDCADLLNQSAEPLSRSLGQAVEALVACLTAGCKVAVCAQDGAAPLAGHLAALLLGRFERNRPPLPALSLDNCPRWTAYPGEHPPLVQQIHALCQPGDLLVAFGLGQDAPELQAAVRAAHDKEVAVVAFLASGDSTVRSLLSETDVAVQAPTVRAARALELHLLALHCLCDALDTQLLGEQDLS